MFRINKGSYTSSFLRLGNGMDGQSGLTAALRTKNLDDASTRIATHTKGGIQSDASGGYHVHLFHIFIAQLHD